MARRPASRLSRQVWALGTPASPVTTCSGVWGGGGRGGRLLFPAQCQLLVLPCPGQGEVREVAELWFQGRGGVAGWAGWWAAGWQGQGSVEATAPKVFGDDDVRHGVKDKLEDRKSTRLNSSH